MKILTQYLMKSLIQPLLYCMLGFTLIFIINDLFDNFSDFLQSDIRPLEILYYYGLVLPPVIVLILPACLLLAMLYSLSRLTRHSEITAMRAGGVSIYRIITPFIGIGIAAALLSGLINEVFAPDAAYRAEQFLEYQKQNRMEDIYFADNIALKRGRHVWHIQKLDTRDRALYNVELIEQREDGSDAIKYQAEKGLWLDGRWWFMDVTVQQYAENGDLLGAPELILQKEMRDISETPQTFLNEIKDAQYLSSREMMQYLEAQTDISSDTRSRLKVDLHARMATPLVCLLVTIIGVPVGAHTGRRGAFAGIMMALTLFFGIYILQLISQALGKQEVIPAWLGGWLPIIFFGSITPFMIHRLR
ncbi:MAG: LptF/LptG family permease [Kiritimatiellales bacterium]|nr:LptF/LptG family permease [Kiritimatiellales bacterium]